MEGLNHILERRRRMIVHEESTQYVGGVKDYVLVERGSRRPRAQ